MQPCGRAAICPSEAASVNKLINGGDDVMAAQRPWLSSPLSHSHFSPLSQWPDDSDRMVHFHQTCFHRSGTEFGCAPALTGPARRHLCLQGMAMERFSVVSQLPSFTHFVSPFRSFSTIKTAKSQYQLASQLTPGTRPALGRLLRPRPTRLFFKNCSCSCSANSREMPFHPGARKM